MKNKGYLRKVYGCLLLCLWGWPSVFSQSVSPSVPDFTDIGAEWVVATYGSTDNPFENQGILPGRHEVITEQGVDECTGGLLQLLPPGESKVVRLGNPDIWAQAESITYHFKVDPDRPLLLLKFAVVFQDPKHEGIYQPRFVVRIMDKDGALIDPCAEYDVSARPGIDGFHTFEYYGEDVRWRDWTPVGLDMSAYVGKEVQVQFVTYDCALQAHFGYAYFTATCISHHLQMENCHGEEFSVVAPDGFATYEWEDGRSDPETVWSKPEEELNLSCQITSATGCRFTLSAHVTSANTLPPQQELYDTICQGERYTKYDYDLPAQDEPGDFIYYNSYYNPENCGYMGTTTLHLKVMPQYYPLDVQLCAGESYQEQGFSWVSPPAGHYQDSLHYPSAVCRCDSVVVLNLTVFPELSVLHAVQGEQHPCTGTVQAYSMSESWEEGSYTWEFPEGFYILQGQGKPTVTVQVTDAARPGRLNLIYGKEGCASAAEPFLITPDSAYWKTWTDSICTGEEYHKHGFDAPVQDSTGNYIFSKTYRTMKGCDSTVILRLEVNATPRLQLLATDSVICPGNPVRLDAVSGNAQAEARVHIGDIYCSDGSIVKPADYPSSGKTGNGVVFYVEDNGEHGWIVHRKNQSYAIEWGFYRLDVYEVPDFEDFMLASTDTAGFHHTQEIRNTASSDYFPAVYAVNVAGGWYVPAIGQLMILYGNLPEVNVSLALIRGDQFSFDDYWDYWSSSEFDDSQAWLMVINGFLAHTIKNRQSCLRAVRSF